MKYDFSTVTRTTLEALATFSCDEQTSAAELERAIDNVIAEATKLPSTDAEILAEVRKAFPTVDALYHGTDTLTQAEQLARILGVES